MNTEFRPLHSTFIYFAYINLDKAYVEKKELPEILKPKNNIYGQQIVF